MQVLCNFLYLLEQSNSHLNLAYQLMQAQHPLNSARKRYFSLILPTSLSLSLELARNQVYTSHIHQHPILISFYFFFTLTSNSGHLNLSTTDHIQQSVGVFDRHAPSPHWYTFVFDSNLGCGTSKVVKLQPSNAECSRCALVPMASVASL